MNSRRSKPEDASGLRMTRRKALALMGAGGATLLAAGMRGLLGLRPSQAKTGGARVSTTHPHWPGKVVVVRRGEAISSSGRVRSEAAKDMAELAVCQLCGEKDPRAAWRRFFDPHDVVAIKVNCLGAPVTRTDPSVVLAVVSGLQAAGIPDENIIIYDRQTAELVAAGYPVNERGGGVRCFGSDSAGYDEELTMVGEAASCFSRIVSQYCTAILNMPVLKDHDMAGITASLKNHFGSINNPNKMHINGCSPYVADVNLAPFIRQKQRLIICDALHVIYDGGPGLKAKTTATYGAILAATDPVALDRVGWDMIDGLRRNARLPTLEEAKRPPRYVAVAADAQHRLGIADLKRIDQLKVSMA